MTDTERGVTATATAFLTAAVVFAAVGSGWPWWLWLPSALVPSAVAVLVYRARTRDSATGHIVRSGHDPGDPPPTGTVPSHGRSGAGPSGATAPAPDTTSPAWPYTRRTVLADLSLASAVDDYRFLFSATVCWLPDPTPDRRTELHANPGALAREAVVSRARHLLAEGAPEEHDLLTERLNAALGTVLSVPAGHLHVWAENISVRLSEEDRDRIRHLAGLRKDASLREQERRYERDLRAYLAEDVLRDPARTVIWFLARTTDGRPIDLDTVVHRLDDLRRLTAAAHATEVPGWETAGPDDRPRPADAPADAPDSSPGRSDDDPALYPSPTFAPPEDRDHGDRDPDRTPASGHM
ncbi:hypothetical protein [Saccharomonospora halophila]|uniref:hypothetical protein n=1 Tax=Saccharomonospora halophila TaxID=129922 RepID=UPI00038058FB|nr:hypothetical protein [Saccharomonospora halophila]